MWLSIRNALGHLAGRRGVWRPLLAVYYLTYSCDFRCPYCSDGARRPYYALRSPTLDADAVLSLLRTVRRYADHLVITGGEPLKHPEFVAVIEGLRAIGFDGIVLTTNGFGLKPHLEAVNGSIRYLVFSLDSLDEERADRWFGVGPGTLEEILSTIDEAARLPDRNYEIIISSVATPDNLEDLHSVYDYARDRDFRFALCPALQGVKAHPALAGDPRYVGLFDRLIEEKRLGRPIQGSPMYLKWMRDLTRFSCRPSTLLAVDPVGNVFYPCLELGNETGNLVKTPCLDDLLRRGIERFGPEPTCDVRCHSACALGFSLALQHPLSVLDEARCWVRGWLDGLGDRRARKRGG